MCEYVDSEYIAPGWGCCHCLKARGMGQYNGMQRTACRTCNEPPCKELTPDRSTGKVFENRNNHKTLYTTLEIKLTGKQPVPGVA